jgi:hypothetical protein
LYILLFTCIAFLKTSIFRKKEELSAMKRMKLLTFVVSAALIAACGVGGCAKGANKAADQSKLEEAKTAAEDAEKKLYDAKQERMRLEAEKGQKKGEDK